MTNTTQAICGHKGGYDGLHSSLSCAVLCDDFCSRTPGYCYLIAFEDRISALYELGTFPTVKKLFEYLMCRFEQETPPFSLTKVGSNILHLSLEDGLNESWFEVTFYCDSCKRTKIMESRTYREYDKNCSTCQEPLLSLCLPKDEIMRMRVGVSLKDIASSIQDLDNLIEYRTEGYVRHNMSAARVEDDIVILRDNVEFKRFPIQSQALKTMRHDYVGNEWEFDTDMKFSVIGVQGPQGNLTPDFIDIENRGVVELGTMDSNYIKSLRTAYDGKKLKYRDICQNADAQLGILIIGVNNVVTNISITQKQAATFVSRLLEILPLERVITHLIGFDVFKSHSSEDVKLAKIVFETMDMKSVPSRTYDEQEILSFSEDLTQKEKAIARNIMQKELLGSRTVKSASRLDLDNYLSQFTPENTRNDQKRITNIPMILAEGGTHATSYLNENVPSHILTLWSQSHSPTPAETIEEMYYRSLDNIPLDEKHGMKKRSLFKPVLSSKDELQLAIVGIGGKAFDSNPDRRAAEIKSKLGFNPDSPIDDIETWIRQENMFAKQRNSHLGSTVRQAVLTSKMMSTGASSQASTDIWKDIIDTKFMSFMFQISYIFTELSYNYKHWTPSGNFMRKDLKHGISIIMHNPKGHLFVSFCFPKSGSTVIDTGRLGPSIFETKTHYITDFCSFNEPTIEHFIKAGPYLSSIWIHLRGNSENHCLEDSEYVKRSLLNISLLYLNNKTDAEELITAQRYLFMKILEDVGSNPWIFVDRLPDVLRSRLTVYLLWKTVGLMDHYSASRIVKVPTYHNDMMLYDYKNIQSLFSKTELTLQQKVNEFYFGYVVSKERGRGGDRMFKVLSKILEQEYKFRDAEDPSFVSSEDTPKYSSNKPLLKFFARGFSDILTKKLGENYKDVIYNEYLSECSKVSFNELSTLKASSRKHPDDFKVPAGEAKSSRDMQHKIDKANPEEITKRPKMIEAMIKMVAQFKSEKGRDPHHIIELLPWCLSTLLNQGYFDSDCFAKPQHGGDREIHVLDSKARIVQFFIELLSKVFCKYFPSETTCNPETKNTFVRDHYTESKSSLKEFNTHSKSADATKWCQLHHTSHFAAMFSVIAPPQLLKFIIPALSLWPVKRLSFPTSLVSTLLFNQTTEPVSPLFRRFREDFLAGKGPFCGKMSNKLNIISGMFQGILHTTSSLYHTMIQEVMKVSIQTLCEMKLMMKTHVTVIQGSDDSGFMMSIKGSLSPLQMRTVKTLLIWKERVSKHIGVVCNEIKSSLGTHDLIEYNSEWHSRHKIIKPTFRWISACMETSVTEKFIDRFRIYNGVLSDCLEGGASTLECAVVQLNQCALHYMLMGLNNHALHDKAWSMIQSCPDPLIGFFPCDFDVAAGVTGVEFQLYCLYRLTSFGKSIRNRISADASIQFSPDEIPSYQKVKDLQSVRLRFGNLKLYKKFISTLPISTYEEALKEIEENPLLIYGRHTSWSEDQPNLVMKVFSPGVKESISNVSSMLRMSASSSYLISMPCFSYLSDDEDKPRRYTLLALINKISGIPDAKVDIKEVFPLEFEYSRVYDKLLTLTNNSIIQDTVLKRTSKVKVIVFDKVSSDFPVSEMAKRMWFNLGSVPLSTSQFSFKWEQLMKLYSFLSPKSGVEGLKETCKNLKMSVVELKFFLESLESRTRSVTLYDSSSKSSSLSHSLSRIYWPNEKLLTPTEKQTNINTLRSNIFSLGGYWCSNHIKEKLITNWITQSEYLNAPIRSLPKRAQKLKIFHDWLVGRPIIDIMSEIITLKQGVIGSFVSVQKGWGNSRKGKGVWLGQVCGTSVEVEMIDNTCTLIKLNHLTESVTLARALINLIEEFSCKFSEDTKTTFKLFKSGNFGSSSAPGIKVEINPDIKFSYVEAIENWKWKVQFCNFNLRLRVVDPTQQEAKEYTILSDSFNSKDWTPDSPIITPDDVLLKWSVGEPVATTLFSTTIGKMIPARRADFLKLMKSERSMMYSSEWNLISFRETLMSSLSLDAPRKSTVDDIDLKQYEDIFSNIMNMDIDENVDRELQSWTDEVDNMEELMAFEISDNDSTEMNEIIKMLQYNQHDETYLAVADNSRVMPTALRFFSFINSLSVVQYNMTFQQLVRKCSSSEHILVPGILGKLISLVLKEFHVASDADDSLEIVDLEMTATVMSDSIKTEEHLNRLDVADIDAKIDLVESLMHRNTSGRLESLLRTKARYERLRDLKMELIDAPINANYEDLMNKVCEIIEERKLTFHQHLPALKMLHVTVIETLLTSDQNKQYTLLTEMEKHRCKTAISSKLANVDLLNLLTATLNISITLGNSTINPNSTININVNISNPSY